MKNTGRIILMCCSVLSCTEPSGPALSVTDVQVIAPLPGRETSVAYLVLHNHSNQTVILREISSPQFARVELHETQLNKGIASMQLLTSLQLKAHTVTGFSAGAKHLMLFAPEVTMAVGDKITLQLHFSSGDLMVVETRLQPRLSLN